MATRINKAQVIRLLVKENPKREGSKSFPRYALYRDGMTVAEYLEAVEKLGGSSADLRWDVQRKYIALEAAPVKAETPKLEVVNGQAAVAA